MTMREIGNNYRNSREERLRTKKGTGHKIWRKVDAMPSGKEERSTKTIYAKRAKENHTRYKEERIKDKELIKEAKRKA